MTANERTGHGWWPYVLPYIAFLGAVEISAKLPEAFAPAALFIKPAVPLVLLLWFWSRGEYPELRGARLDLSGATQDVLVGVGLAVLWMAPFVFIHPLRPEAEGFDTNVLGPGLAGLALAVRMFGYALVTPFFEEIFIRSFVMRYAEVYSERGDFRDVPLAHYTPVSFVTTVVVFTLGHVPWEWWVAVPWVMLTNLWFYRRGNLRSVILVHGVTNATILLLALGLDGFFGDGEGGALSLWFFV